MKLISVNIGKIRSYSWRNETQSALHKLPVQDLQIIEPLGLIGDEQADKKNHGGLDKAIFILPEQNYELFNIHQPFGFLGENLTISGLDETEVCLGDRFQIGNVLLEVTQPRSPCWKLGQQASSQEEWSAGEFLKHYSESGRVGFYCRVLAKGSVQAGQSVTWLTRDNTAAEKHGIPEKITIQTLFLAKQLHRTEQDWTLLKTALKHPALSSAWKANIEQLLSQPIVGKP